MKVNLRAFGCCVLVAGLSSLGWQAAAQQPATPSRPPAAGTSQPPAGARQAQAAPSAPTSPAAAQAPAPASAAAPRGISVPQAEVLLVMVRSALIALDQANKTGNYTVLHGMGGPALQQHSPARLGELFAGVRQSNADLQPVLVLTPQLTRAPEISPQGVLSLIGHFPSQPLQIQFQVAYQPVGNQWRLAGLNTSLVPVATTSSVAPPPAAQPAPAASAPAKKAPAAKQP